MVHQLQAMLMVLGVIFIAIISMGLAIGGRHPKRNLKIVLPALCIAAMLLIIDCTNPPTKINRLGIVAHKTMLPPAPHDSSHYAFFVIRANRHWLFRVSKERWLTYDENDRIRLVTYYGRLSGYTYKTTLH